MIKISTLLLICSTHYYSNSQNTTKTADEPRKEIEEENNRIEQLYINEDVQSLTRSYDSELTFFAEYKPAIFEINKLEDFFKNWFKTVNISAYKKTIHSVEEFTDHFLEIGRFRLNFSTDHKKNGEYAGKYMMLWKRDKDKKLRIVSETFGAEKPIEPEEVPYAEVQVKRNDSSQGIK
jgi:ketosteroid isomerase-like protein